MDPPWWDGDLQPVGLTARCCNRPDCVGMIPDEGFRTREAKEMKPLFHERGGLPLAAIGHHGRDGLVTSG